MAEDNIFREVDEELRNERMRQLWRKYAPLVFGLAFAIVAAVAAKEGWDYYQKSISSTSSDNFYAAIELIEKGDLTAANQALEKIKNEASGKYPLLAEFRQAALLLEEGKNKEAIAAYDSLANKISEQSLRDLALIFAANALVDSGDVAGVNARISGLINDENPLSLVAQEILGLTHYAAGDIDKAREIFENIIISPRAQADIIGRVNIYISQLKAEGAKEPANVANAGETEIITENNN